MLLLLYRKEWNKTMIDIQCKDGKYIIDARIHSEVDTNDIAKAQERFTSDCAYEFAEAMREAVNISHLVMKEQRKEVTK
mgnify:CR=1 FL=1